MKIPSVPVVYAIHGFNDGHLVKGRSERSDVLDPVANDLRFAGLEVAEGDYGPMGIIGTYIADSMIAAQIAAFSHILKRHSNVNLYLLAHSNGGLISAMATAMGADLAGVFLFNPALDRDFDFKNYDVPIWCYYTPSDTPTLFAKLLPKHGWGSMGRYGPDWDARCIAKANVMGVELDMITGVDDLGHSGFSRSDQARAMCVDDIIARLRGREIELAGVPDG